MKLTTILLLAAFLQVSAKGYTQNLTMSLKNVSLQKVFKEINKQTGYQFLYKDELLNNADNIDIEVREATIKEVLNICFKNLAVTYSIGDKAIVLKHKEIKNENGENTPPPFVDITGRVLNEKGEPVEVSITVKGTKNFARSDVNGNFKLIGVDVDATLLFTGVNIEAETIQVKGRGKLEVRVKTKIKMGQDVQVSTALGIEKSAKELGYSVAKVTGEEINRTSPTNLLVGLAGRVAGLQVVTQSADLNPQMKVLLRGIRSISDESNNLPLFVLNGSPISFGSNQVAANLAIDFVNNINPNDILDVTILKGANGASLYGPEGVRRNTYYN